MTSAVIIETATAIVILSHLLPYGVKRWATIGVAILQTASVDFFLTGVMQISCDAVSATIAIDCAVFIVWRAWIRRPS